MGTPMISAFGIAIGTASLDCEASLTCNKIRVSASLWLHLKYDTSTFSFVTLKYSSS